MTAPGGKVDFFISYTAVDDAWARWLDFQLREAGFSTLVQAYDFCAGSNFVIEMQGALERCQRMLAVWSAAYFKSRFCAPEIAAIFATDPDGRRRKLVPIRIEAVQPVGLWCPVVYVDFVGQSREQCSARLLEAARGAVRPTAEPPFPGHTIAERQNAARFPGVPPTVWNVPHSRNMHFRGRDDVLQRLHSRLSSGRDAALTQALKGLGGVGKTQLALEYAYRYSSAYDGVWWLRAEDPDGLRRDYVALAAQLGVPVDNDESVTVGHVRQALSQRGGVLLIFDNAPDARAIESYLPQGAARRVLVTSRAQHWPNAEPEPIQVMTTDEAIELLVDSCDREPGRGGSAGAPERSPSREQQAARDIAALVGNLPLALAQAAGYVQATGIALGEYVNLLRRHGLSVVAKGQASDTEASVRTTWTLAMEQVATENESAAQLLMLCAFLAPDNIALTDIVSGRGHLPEPLQGCTANGLAMHDVQLLLRRYSLVDFDHGRLTVHRLVQWATRESLSDTDKVSWRSIALAVLDQTFPKNPSDVRSWADCARLVTHVRAVADAEAGMLGRAATRLLSNAGLYLYARAEHVHAEPLMRRALSIDEASYGSEHPDVAIHLNNLALLLKATNRLGEAEPLMRRALSIDEASYGSEHPNVAIRLNNLAMLLQDTNRLGEAEPLMRRALSIDEASYGSEHPNVAIRLNNLALLLQATSRLGEAEPMIQRACLIFKRALGDTHPYTVRAERALDHIRELASAG